MYSRPLLSLRPTLCSGATPPALCTMQIEFTLIRSVCIRAQASGARIARTAYAAPAPLARHFPYSTLRFISASLPIEPFLSPYGRVCSHRHACLTHLPEILVVMLRAPTRCPPPLFLPAWGFYVFNAKCPDAESKVAVRLCIRLPGDRGHSALQSTVPARSVCIRSHPAVCAKSRTWNALLSTSRAPAKRLVNYLRAHCLGDLEAETWSAARCSPVRG
jgi:hypothetical protein